MMLSRRRFIVISLAGVTTGALAETVYDEVGKLVVEVFNSDPGNLLAEAMIDAGNADGALDAALSVAAKAAIGEPIDAVEYGSEGVNTEAVLQQMAQELDRARKFAKNSRRKISEGLERGGGQEPLSELVLNNVREYGLNVKTYAGIYESMRENLEELETALAEGDVGQRLSRVLPIRKRLIDLRTLLNGGRVEQG